MSRSFGPLLGFEEGKPADSDAVVVEHDHGALDEVVLDRHEVADNECRHLSCSTSASLAEKENGRSRGVGAGEKLAEVRVRRQHDSILLFGQVEQFLVGGAGQAQVSDMDGVVARLSKGLGNER